MEIKLKAKILEESMRDLVMNPELYEQEDLSTFLSYNDLGIPIAQAYSYDLITGLTEEGKNLISETWFYFCNMMFVDPDADYEDLDDVWIAIEDEDDL
jgi:hypothetical protein